jgi:hypothetical protein
MDGHRRSTRFSSFASRLCLAVSILVGAAASAAADPIVSDCVISVVEASPILIAPGGPASFTVMVSEGTDPSFTCSSANYQAAETSDFTAGTALSPVLPTGLLALASPTASVTVVPPASPNGGGTATFNVACTAGCDFTSTPSTVTVQILHVLSIEPVTQPEGTGGSSTMTFTITRGGSNVSGEVSVQVDTVDGSATGGGDYVPIVAQTVNIPDGSASTSFDVTIDPDADPELDETFSVELSNPIGAVLAVTSAVGTLGNDDLLAAAVPTASDWTLLLLTLGLAAAGCSFLRRQIR